MGYFADGDLPALHALAKSFTVCDRWFSSVPGPTWANRLFAMSGTSLGRVTMPDIGHGTLAFGYDQDTIFDRLNEQGIPWRVYFGDFPLSFVLSHQRRPLNALRHRPLLEFFSACAGPEAGFPAFAFIEPKYFPPEQNDDHPPHSSRLAQALLARVYNAIRANDDLWHSSLLVVLYDEHGGFYDHVSPPDAVPPSIPPGHIPEYDFKRLGIRVPALLISPWAPQKVIHTTFDHTSLLKYMSDKWQLAPLTERVSSAASFASEISTNFRTDTPASLPVPGPELLLVAAVPQPVPLNEHQAALIRFARQMETDLMGLRGASPAALIPTTPSGDAGLAALTRAEPVVPSSAPVIPAFALPPNTPERAVATASLFVDHMERALIPEQPPLPANFFAGAVPAALAAPTPAATLEGRLLCASNCAYFADSGGGLLPEIPPLYLKGAGFRDGPVTFVHGLDNINACLVGTSQDGVVIAFRGTLPLDGRLSPVFDWVNNIDDILIESAGLPGKVHAGFAHALATLWDDIMPVVNQRLTGAGPAAKLFITGHSKGGAVAYLAAIRLAAAMGIVPTVCTFAAAKPGDHAFAAAFDNQLQASRYEFQDDIVPHLPPSASLDIVVPTPLPSTDYASAGTLRFIDWNNRVVADSDDLRKERTRRLLGLILSRRFARIVDDHRIGFSSGYMSALY
ncbi:MAG TPA: alkaline phosphatase family protein, partial [Gemmataceae bacterium]|nr:alkaline phosphatase family protein [Gemmataceae bacterium]